MKGDITSCRHLGPYIQDENIQSSYFFSRVRMVMMMMMAMMAMMAMMMMEKRKKMKEKIERPLVALYVNMPQYTKICQNMPKYAGCWLPENMWNTCIQK